MSSDITRRQFTTTMLGLAAASFIPAAGYQAVGTTVMVPSSHVVLVRQEGTDLRGPFTVPRSSYPNQPSDSSATIQAAIDALPASGGTVILAPGQYNLNRIVYLRDNVTIVGSGPGLTELICSPGRLQAKYKANVHIVGLGIDLMATQNHQQGLKFEACTHVRVSECSFYSSVPYKPEFTNQGIAAFRCADVIVEHCVSDGVQFKLAGGGGGSNLIVRKCWFNRPNKYAISAVLLQPGGVIDYVNIEDCTVIDPVAAGAFYIGSDAATTPAGSQVNNITIRDCQVRGVFRAGEDLWRACKLFAGATGTNWLVERLDVKGSAKVEKTWGVLVASRDGLGKVSNVVVNDVRVTNVEFGGVEINACAVDHFEIRDCQLTNTRGVRLIPGAGRDITHGAIVGNRVRDAEHFVYVDTTKANVQNVEITGNDWRNVRTAIQYACGAYTANLHVHDNTGECLALPGDPGEHCRT